MEAKTYGKSPAAIYLASHLTTVGSVSLQRKVGRILASQRELLNELTEANVNGHLTTRTLGRLLSMISLKNHAAGEYIKTFDNLAGNLVTNILEGEVKLWKNRTTYVRRCAPTLQRNTPPGCRPPKLSAAAGILTGEKTDTTLVERSRAKLIRLNKLNTLY